MILLVTLGAGCFTSTAYADVLYQNSVGSGNYVIPGNTMSGGTGIGTNGTFQRLGTGLSGVVSEVDVQIKEGSNSGDIVTSKLEECSSDTNIYISPSQCTDVLSTTHTLGAANSSGDVHFTWPSNYTLNASKYYLLRFYQNSNDYVAMAGATTTSYLADHCDYSVVNNSVNSAEDCGTGSLSSFTSSIYFLVIGIGADGNSTTHIFATTPAWAAVVATTSPIALEATGYVNQPTAFYSSYEYLDVRMQNVDAREFTNNLNCTGDIETVISMSNATGVFDATGTAATLNPSCTGHYTVQWALVHKDLGFSAVVDFATTTEFSYGIVSPYEAIIAQGQQTLAMLGQGAQDCALTSIFTGGLSSSTFAGCFYWIIVPSNADLTSLYNTGLEKWMTKFPIGYVSRTYSIFTQTATGTLPSLVITLPSHGALSNFPGAGAQIDLTPWNNLLGPTSLLATATSTETGLTIRQIVEPGWDTFVLICFGLAVLQSLMGAFGRVAPFNLGGGAGSADDSGPLSRDEAYRRKVASLNR